MRAAFPELCSPLQQLQAHQDQATAPGAQQPPPTAWALPGPSGLASFFLLSLPWPTFTKARVERSQVLAPPNISLHPKLPPFLPARHQALMSPTRSGGPWGSLLPVLSAYLLLMKAASPEQHSWLPCVTATGGHSWRVPQVGPHRNPGPRRFTRDPRGTGAAGAQTPALHSTPGATMHIQELGLTRTQETAAQTI